VGKFVAACQVEPSQIFDNGTSVGVGTTTPAAKLDVKGPEIVRGTLTLPATGNATSTGGKNSNAINFAASAYNGTSAVTQNFRWAAEPVSNGSAAASGKLSLQFGSGTTLPTDTGLSIASNGLINFVPGQTYPGAGTITGITAGSGLSGGGTSGNVAIGLTTSCVNGQILQWNGSVWACSNPATGTITGVKAGADLTGGGTNGNVTLALDTTKVPLLVANNNFTGSESVNGTLTVGSSSTYQPFLVQTNSTFGTWLELSNTSTGGHTWNILSAGGTNAEGAGNLGITDLTGTSTIWLEGNVNTNNVSAAAVHATGTVRSESGLSLGGTAPVTVDAPGVVGGRLAVLANGNVGINNANPATALDVNGSVRINGDAPMSSNPRMSFSGYIQGSFCGNINCGGGGSSGPGGFLIPDRNIEITRVNVTLGSLMDPSCNATIEIFVNGSLQFSLAVPGNTWTFNSATTVNVPAGQGVLITYSPATSCSLGASAGGNALVNAEYVME
jgi:hypothetical protein